MDAAALRKEIKAWERSFRTENSRDATVEDIRGHPKIAEKYKLYKKLSKDQAPLKKSNDPPRTPPRRTNVLAVSPTLVPKTRATASSVASSSNPFSPVKTPRKSIQHVSPNDAPLGMPNFQTAFGLGNSNGPPHSFDEQNISKADPPSRTGRAVSKARKRLRGDSVSPSPKKLPRISAPIPANTLEEEDQLFVDDSPVKPSAGGKGFVSLFDEERIPAPDFLGRRSSHNSSNPSKKPTKEQLVFPSQKQPSSTLNGKKSAAEKMTLNKLVRTISAKQVRPDAPGLHQNKGEGSQASSRDGSTNRKRRSPEGSARSTPDPDAMDASLTTFLPPSPPQDGQKKGHKTGFKDMGKKRKKMGVLATDDVSEDDDRLDDENLEIVELTPLMKCRVDPRHSSDEDEEHLYVRQRNEETIDPSQPEDSHALEVALPDELRDVLYISQSQSSEKKERDIAESLLKGESRHPGQSGVWGIGEVVRPGLVSSDDEEDWEGEGTPWEVGEM